MSLDLRKLEHLVAVVEEGGYTRAARRLHLSQQALSTSIRALEREVGVPLLDRSRSRVVVLPAGEALVADARVLLGAARAALQRARRVGRGEEDVLRVGHTPAVTGEEVTALLAGLHTEQPDVRTDVVQRFPGELTRDLLHGSVDVGLCRAMPTTRGLSRATVGEQRLHIAVRAGHRLAGRESVALTDLRDERLMVWGDPGRSGYTDLLVDTCRAAGFEPTVERNPVQGTPPVTAVLDTDHVAFVTTPPGPAIDGRVRVLELRPPVHVPLLALWPDNVQAPARDRLLAHLGHPA